MFGLIEKIPGKPFPTIEFGEWAFWKLHVDGEHRFYVAGRRPPHHHELAGAPLPVAAENEWQLWVYTIHRVCPEVFVEIFGRMALAGCVCGKQKKSLKVALDQGFVQLGLDDEDVSGLVFYELSLCAHDLMRDDISETWAWLQHEAAEFAWSAFLASFRDKGDARWEPI